MYTFLYVFFSNKNTMDDVVKDKIEKLFHTTDVNCPPTHIFGHPVESFHLNFGCPMKLRF